MVAEVTPDLWRDEFVAQVLAGWYYTWTGFCQSSTGIQISSRQVHIKS